MSAPDLWTLIKGFLLNVLGNIDIKAVLRKLVYDSVFPELEKLVANTATQWDDMALKAVRYIVELLLGSPEEAAKARDALKS